MPSAFPRKARSILAMLLACVALTIIIECQVHHAVQLTSEHTLPTSHHHSCSRSGMDGACILAVLSGPIFFMLFLFFTFQARPLVLKYTLHIFPLFIPPRTTAQQPAFG